MLRLYPSKCENTIEDFAESIKNTIPKLEEIVDAYMGECRSMHSDYSSYAEEKSYLLSDKEAKDTMRWVVKCVKENTRILDGTTDKAIPLTLSYIILFCIAFQHTLNDLVMDTGAAESYKSLFTKMQIKSEIEPYRRDGIHDLLLDFKGFAMTVVDAYIKSSLFAINFDYLVLLYLCQCLSEKHDKVFLIKEAIQTQNWRALVCMLLADAIPLPECEKGNTDEWQLWFAKVINFNGNKVVTGGARELSCMQSALKEIIEDIASEDASDGSSLSKEDIYEGLSSAIRDKSFGDKLEYVLGRMLVNSSEDTKRGLQMRSDGILEKLASRYKIYLNFVICDVFNGASVPDRDASASLPHFFHTSPATSSSTTPATSSISSSAASSPESSPPPSPPSSPSSTW